MPREKYFPVFFIRETDGMVFEMPIGINGFIITVAPIHVCPGISRIVDDTKDAAVGQRSPCEFSVPGTSESAFRERKIVFGEIPDNAVGASGSTEGTEQGGECMLYFFIRIHDGFAIRIINIANRQWEAQFSPGSGVFFPAAHTGMKEMKFCFANKVG